MELIETDIGELNVLTSMCPDCQEEGVTRLLFLEIPHFKRLIISSFECHNNECGLSNREVQFGDEYPEHGVKLSLFVTSEEHLNRQIVKSEYGEISIPELNLEIPSSTQVGAINTIEGVLRKVMDDLSLQQAQRREQHPELADQIDEFLKKLDACLRVETPFHLSLDDCSGNSHIETFPGDKSITRSRYNRSREQNMRIGLAVDDLYSTHRTAEEEAILEAAQIDDIYALPETCSNCSKTGMVKMHKIDIPFFKEVIIMAFACDHCGYRNNEVRNGGAIEPKGRRITLKVLNSRDLCRDVLRSETSSIHIPEMDFHLESGGNQVGCGFTTVEGLISQVLEQLERTQVLSFASGDSAQLQQKTEWQNFVGRLQGLKDGVEPFTLILDDPAGSIYIQNPRAHLMPPENIDVQLEVEDYERTEEQNEELGILDMKTENYHATQNASSSEPTKEVPETEAKPEPQTNTEAAPIAA